MDEITIRRITDVITLHAVEALQQRVWGMPPQEIVPSHQLLATTQAGGAVFGAFTPTGRLVGFCYGFVGLRDGAVLFYSHMAGVDGEYRGAQVGFRLKCAQRQFALDQGITRMIWTFDPLVGPNAYFNLHKLGAVANRYYVNYYGEMLDALNRGVESDRLEVDWWLRSPHVEAALQSTHPTRQWDEAAPVLTATRQNAALVPGEPILDIQAPALRLEVPLALAPLKTTDTGVAHTWRATARQAFLHYLARGYSAVDFLIVPHPPPARGAYILSQAHEVGRS